MINAYVLRPSLYLYPPYDAATTSNLLPPQAHLRPLPKIRMQLQQRPLPTRPIPATKNQLKIPRLVRPHEARQGRHIQRPVHDLALDAALRRDDGHGGVEAVRPRVRDRVLADARPVGVGARRAVLPGQVLGAVLRRGGGEDRGHVAVRVVVHEAGRVGAEAGVEVGNAVLGAKSERGVVSGGSYFTHKKLLKKIGIYWMGKEKDWIGESGTGVAQVAWCLVGLIGGGTNLEMFNSDHVPTRSERAFSGCIVDTSADDDRKGEFANGFVFVWSALAR